VLTRNGEIAMLDDDRGRELEKLRRSDWCDDCSSKKIEEVVKGQVLCEWNPHKIPILTEVAGKVRL
jgi:DNA-directed RNA polymerase subunit beta'